MEKKAQRFKNQNNFNLGTIDETNENSFFQSTMPKDATSNFNTQRGITNKENLQFTKIPKFLTSTIHKPKEQTNTYNKNFKSNLFEPSAKPKNYERNSKIPESEFFSENENIFTKDGLNRSERKDKIELNHIKPNDSPNVSYLNQFLDFFLNW